jgi:eukaryotic-like serine/threonine-protein kinase
MNSSASPLVAPGAIVAGKYRLDAVVGEGGMGSVWAATHVGLGHTLAIKFVSREFISSAEALRRFDAEAKAAAQLRSRHVVQVYDNGTLEDGTPYIAMELLHGENLHARVHRAGPVPLNEAAEILSQCCKALGRAHAAGIVHRDIKPDNIFLARSQDDDSYVAKILDFGIAKFAPGPNDHGSTRTGAVLGTPLYMSPEQARGLKSIDYRTDLYSLGLVAYTMLTGNLAFSSESFGDLLLQICTAPLPSLCGNAPWLPPTIEPWFQRACARDPQERYASAQEFADALRAAAGFASPSAVLPAASAVGQPMSSVGYPVAPGTGSGMSRSGDLSNPAGVPRAGKLPLVALALVLLFGGIGLAAVVAVARRGHTPEAAGPSSSPTAVASSPPVAPAFLEPLPSLQPAAESARPTGRVEPRATSASSAQPVTPAPVAPSARAAGVHPPAPVTSGHPRTTTSAASTAPIDLGY